jgi:hypothetical protein
VKAKAFGCAVFCAGVLVFGAHPAGADEAARAFSQQQMLRQQQQEALQLRLQQQRRVDAPEVTQREQQALGRLEGDQRWRLDGLHGRQRIDREQQLRQPMDGAPDARLQIELHRAGEEGQRELRRLDDERRSRAGAS